MIRNIIIINDTAYVNGGAAKVAITSALRLSQRGYRVIFFTAKEPICEELRLSDVEVVCTYQYDILSDPNRFRAMEQGIWNCKSRKMLKHILAHLSPAETIIHVHGWIKALSVSIFKAISQTNIPVFYTLHDFFLYCPNGGLYDYKKQQICHRKPMGISCMFCNCDSRNYPQKMWRVIRQSVCKYVLRDFIKDMHFISISDLTEQIFKREYGCNFKVTRINNPVETPMSIAFNDKCRDSYLFMARLSPEKGLDLFCQAITQLDLKGIVLGTGELYEDYKKKYPNIEFVGWVDGKQKLPYLQRTKCLIFPSKWYECAPLTTIEVMSYGIPCITPDKCAASELIQEGTNGFIFQIGNLNSLKDAIHKMEKSNLLYQRIKIQNNMDISNYSEEKHIDRLISIYETECNNRFLHCNDNQ